MCRVERGPATSGLSAARFGREQFRLLARPAICGAAAAAFELRRLARSLSFSPRREAFRRRLRPLKAWRPPSAQREPSRQKPRSTARGSARRSPSCAAAAATEGQLSADVRRGSDGEAPSLPYGLASSMAARREAVYRAKATTKSTSSPNHTGLRAAAATGRFGQGGAL